MNLLPCAILVPSLNRPHRLLELTANIHAATKARHKILFCVSDDESKRILRSLGEWFLDDSDQEDRRYVTRMNKLASEARARGYASVFFGQDDVRFHEDWLEEAIVVMEATGKQVCVVNDMHNQNGTATLMAAEYIQRAVVDETGNVFYSGYQHNFADNEQFATADAQGELCRAPRSRVEHFHPAFGGAPMDATYALSGEGWGHDLALFQSRANLIQERLRP